MSSLMLVKRPIEPQVWHLIERAKERLVLCAPFVGQRPCQRVIDHVQRSVPDLFVSILTDLSFDNLLSGATDIHAIAKIASTCRRVSVRFLPSLHAKVYVADETAAIVTSANFTESGLGRNFEYGAEFSDTPTVSIIRRDILSYARMGSPISADELQTIAAAVGELRDLRRAEERSTRTRIRREFEKRLATESERLLHVRVGGRAPHAIFADAILHLLRIGSLPTRDLHREVQSIHPDLCDDLVDRVIEGKHFGKKWKHAVRTAQQHLKKAGQIELVGGRWRLINADAADHEFDL